MQDKIVMADALQAIDICESNGLVGTAAAFRRILKDINQANAVTRKTHQDNVAEKQKAE